MLFTSKSWIFWPRAPETCVYARCQTIGAEGPYLANNHLHQHRFEETPGYAQPRYTILNLNENQGGAFDDLFGLTMNVPINILILMESHLEN